MKLRVVYSDTGESVPDLTVNDWLETLLNKLKYHVGDTMTIEVGTGCMVLAIRLAIFREQLNHEDVVFVYEGQELIPDKNARIKPWPDGFCDTSLYMLESIFGV